MLHDPERRTDAAHLTDVELTVFVDGKEMVLVRRNWKATRGRTSDGTIGWKRTPLSAPHYFLRGPSSMIEALFERGTALRIGVTHEAGNERDRRSQTVSQQSA
jgi:hypothetical protein